MATFEDIFNDDDDSTVTVALPAPDGKGEVEYEVYLPTSGQLMIFAAAYSDSTKAPGAILGLLEDLFEPDDFAEILARLRARRSDPARLKLGDLTGVIENVMEGRSGFPTEPSSGSSSSGKPTGRRSTGRVHSQALTPGG